MLMGYNGTGTLPISSIFLLYLVIYRYDIVRFGAAFYHRDKRCPIAAVVFVSSCLLRIVYLGFPFFPDVWSFGRVFVSVSVFFLFSRCLLLSLWVLLPSTEQ